MPYFFLVYVKDIAWALSQQCNIFIQNLFFVYVYMGRFRGRVSRYRKISFCITCMNRAKHIKKTLRKNMRNNAAYPYLEFVLLDYNSQDDLQEWVFKHFKKEIASGRLVYYQTKKPQAFEMSRAKNMAHQLASGEVVCNLDADNYAGYDFAFYINSVMDINSHSIGAQDYIHKKNIFTGSPISDCGGRIFLLKEFFTKLGGYDERFVAYGCEDIDFKMRAKRFGLTFQYIPRYFLKAIRHTNRLREKNMLLTTQQALKINHAFMKTKNEDEVVVSNVEIDLGEVVKIGKPKEIMVEYINNNK